MVAKTAKLPNLRKLFIPDEGYTIFDVDLDRADAQVVAWEADDAVLKQMFREGVDVHTANAMDIYGCSREAVNIGGAESPRQKAKIACHAVNYGCKARTLAGHINTTQAEAERFIRRWFDIHPGIQDWHKRIESSITSINSIRNAFGYRMYFFDRADQCLPEALAWIPQSTVSGVIDRGMVSITEELHDVQMLLQVHDSLVFQVPTEKLHVLVPEIRKRMLVTVPYPDPLVIPITLKASNKSWGDVEKYDTFLAKLAA